MTNKALLFLGFLTVTASTTVALKNLEYPHLRDIEVFFSDKSNNEKRAKLSVEALTTTKDYKIYIEEETDESKKWVKFISFKENTILWSNLFSVASKFLQVQHKINVIKGNAEEQAINFLKTACSDSNTKNKCCCDSNKSCEVEKLIKLQRTFNYLRSNLESGKHNVYLTPVRAYIKFHEIDFDDLETKNITKKELEVKRSTFSGVLVYGFSDYTYKHTPFKQELLPKDSNRYLELENEKDFFFSNNPQKINFSYVNTPIVKKQEPDKEEENKNDLNYIYKQLENYKLVKDLSLNWKSKDKEIKDDCSKDNDYLDCLITKNYISLINEEENIEKLKDKLTSNSSCF